MNRVITGLLIAILSVLSMGVILVATDEFDDKVHDYAFVELERIELDNRLDILTDELSDTFEKSKVYIDSGMSEQDMVKHMEKMAQLLSDINQLKVDTEEIEIADPDIREIHEYLVIGLKLLEEGTMDLQSACENEDLAVMESAGEKLSNSYSNVEEWRKLVLEYTD